MPAIAHFLPEATANGSVQFQYSPSQRTFSNWARAWRSRGHGVRRPTYDIDITPATTQENLERLSALRELNAGIRIDDPPEGPPFDCTGESLRGMQMLNLRTAAGDPDLTFVPARFPSGYESLLQARSIGGITVTVAGLNDVIKSKIAAARAKDLDALPQLIHLGERDRNRSQGRDYSPEL